MQRFGFVILAISLVTASSASAQSVAQPQAWTATPFLNVAFGTGGSTSSGGFGAGVGYDFTSNLGVEGEFGHLFDVAGDSENVDWSVTSFSANAIYHFDVIRVTPYATAGIGFERSSVNANAIEPTALLIPSSTEVTFNFGGGVKYPMTGKLLARADLRRFQANDLAPDFWRLYAGVTLRIR